MSVYYSIANHFFTPGLWRADATTGESITLIDGTDEDGSYTLVADPRALSDGYLYSFATVTDSPDPNDIMQLTMYRSAPDGSELEALRSDRYNRGHVLWAEDASGAVIEDRTIDQSPESSGQLLWLPADGSPAVSLDIGGYNLRWGKP